MSEPHRIKDEFLRDLGLILVGHALSKTDRQRVLDSVPPGLLLRETDDLLNAIRNNSVEVLTVWCEARGAKIERGKDVIQAIIDALLAEKRRQAVKRILAQLNTSTKILHPGTLAAKLRECADELDGLMEIGK